MNKGKWHQSHYSLVNSKGLRWDWHPDGINAILFQSVRGWVVRFKLFKTLQMRPAAMN